jgi:hypothetical protein
MSSWRRRWNLVERIVAVVASIGIVGAGVSRPGIQIRLRVHFPALPSRLEARMRRREREKGDQEAESGWWLEGRGTHLLQLPGQSVHQSFFLCLECVDEILLLFAIASGSD